MSDMLQVIGLGIGIVIGLGGMSATVWAIGRVRGIETSIGVLNSSIDALNSANEGLRDANRDLTTKLDQGERDCSERISRLEGQNSALLDGLGEKLAAVIGSRLEVVLESAAIRIVEGLARRSADREQRFNPDQTVVTKSTSTERKEVTHE